MNWKDRVKANEESGENAKVRAEAAGMLSGAMKQHLVTSGEYKDQAQMDQFNRYISEYNDIVQKFGSSGLDISGQNDFIKSFKSISDEMSHNYSQFKNRAEFDSAKKAQSDYEGMLSYDTKSGRAELDQLKKHLEKARSLVPAGYSTKEGANRIVNPNTKPLSNYLKSIGYSSLNELEKDVTQKQQYLNLSERTQHKAKLESDAANDKEFSQYAAQGAAVKNPSVDDATPSFQFFGKKSGGEEVTNKVAYTRDNYDEIMKRSASAAARGAGYQDSNFNAELMEMTDDEVNTYNYYLAKFGSEKADEYLDSLTETLRYRQVNKRFDNVEGKTAQELAFSIAAGLDQFGSGMKALFNDEEYIVPSAISMESGMIREDLADVGPQVFGSSLGQGVYDLGTTGSNMLPSIAVSSIIGLVSKEAGAVVGSTLLGTSAAGNAYAEMLNLGYNEDQARTYGYITGALEGGLQYILGGIGKLGGKVTGEVLEEAIKGINNGAAKFAIKFGGKMAEEGLEEALQEIISPMLKNAIFNTEDKVDWEQVAYSGLLGALSAGMFNSADAVTNTTRINREFKEVYGQNAQDLVAEGMESAEGTKSRQLAEQFAKELAGGKDLTGRQLKKLVNANEEAIKAENAQNALPTNVSEAEILSEGKVSPKTEINAEGTAEAVSDADVIRDSIADMKVNKATADALVNGFDAADGVSVEDYVLGAKEAYKYGSVGMKAEYISKEGFASKLTENQMKLAYNLGKTDAKYATAKAQEAIDAKVAKANALPTNEGKIVYHLDREVSVDELKPIQRASIKYAEAVAAVVGNNVNVFESVVDKNGNRVFAADVGQFKAGTKAPNGFYDTKTGEIYIDLNAGNSGSGTMLYTLGHEYTHFIRQNAPAKFKALADFLMEEFSDKGVPAKTLIHNQMQKAKKAGRDIDFDTAFEEVVADAMESMLTDTNVAEKIQKLKQTDKTLWQKLKDMITKLFKSIQNIYKGLNPDSLEANYVREMKDSLEKLSDLFAEGLAAAGEAYQSIGSVAGVSMEYSVNDSMTGADISDITKKPLTKLQERTEYERLPKEMIKVTASGAVRSPMAITINGKTFNKTASVRELRNARFKENGFKSSDVIKINDFLDKMRDYLKDARVKYTYVGLQDVYDAKIIISPTTDSIVLSAMVNNGDYEINFDFTKTCKKRISIQEVIEQLAREKGKLNGDGTTTEVDLSEENLRHINEVLAANGIETACLCCFVESKRYAMQSHYQEKVCDVWNALVDEVNAEEGNEKPAPYFNFADSDVETSKIPDEEFDKLYAELSRWRSTKYEKDEESEGAVKLKMKAFLQNTPSARKKLRLSDFVTEAGRTNLHKLYPDVESLAKAKIGTAIPKTVETFAPYNGEIELLSVTDTDGIEAHVAKIAGVRSQSFSDFIMSHVYDVLQKTASLTARKLSAHTYTKEISRARLFGQTGEKHNMSVLHEVDPDVDSWYAGLRDDGSYFVSDYDAFSKGECHQIQSIPDTESIALQNTEGYSRDCGRIGVGFSYSHMLKMHNDPDIRQVIGYHTSSLPAILKPMTNLDKAADYTPVQNTLYFNGFKAPNYDLPEGVPSYATPPQDVKPRFKTTKRGKQSKERLPKYSKSNAGFDIQGRYKELSKTMDGAAAAKETLRELLQFADDNGLFFMTSKYKNGHADFDLYGDVEQTQNPYVTADNYIEYCISQGMLPMFYEFALNDNYYKDLWDFNAFDRLSYNPETGLHEDTPERKAYAPQLPVHMINEDGTMAFPDDFWELVDKYMKDYNYQREDFAKKFPKIMKEVRAIKDSQGVPMIRDSSEQAVTDATNGDAVLLSDRVTDEFTETVNGKKVNILEYLNSLDDSEFEYTYKSMSFWGYDKDGNAILRSPMAESVGGKMTDAYLISKDGKPVWFKAVEDTSGEIPKEMMVKVKNWRNEKGKIVKEKFLKAVEHPELIADDWSNLYFHLVRTNVETGDPEDVYARYNPYEHSSDVMLNDQFKGAYKRPNLVTVLMKAPKFEQGAYRAKYSKDPTGWLDWKSGDLSGKIAAQNPDYDRRVYLSKYITPVAIVSNAEVAQQYKELIDGTSVKVPDNVVPPALLSELIKIGVPIEKTGKIEAYESSNKKSPYANQTTYDINGNEIPLTEFFDSLKGAQKNNTKFSDRDSEYLELAKNPEQNKEKLQVMVDEAAKAAGYTEQVFHGTGNQFNVFRKSVNGIYTTDDETVAQTYGSRVLRLFGKKGNKVLRIDAHNAPHFSIGKEYIPLDFSEYPLLRGKERYRTDDISKIAHAEGYDVVVISNVYDAFSVVSETDGDGFGTDIIYFNPNQIKSADPVTYDDDGNIIPLSKRFNESDDDIRYSDRDSAFNELYAVMDDGRLKVNNYKDLSTEDWTLIYKTVKKLGYDVRSAKEAKDIYTRFSEDGTVTFNSEQSKAIMAAYGATVDSGASSNPTRAKAAKKEYGTTADFREAGYLLQDGYMLDFSGKKDGGPAHVRYMDHREIARVFDTSKSQNYGDNTQYMNAFISEGNIRLMESQGVTIGEIEPTAKQYTILKRFIDHVLENEGYFYLDLSNKDGRTIESREYGSGDNSARVINDIKGYFKNGELPYRSELQQFRYSDRDSLPENAEDIAKDYFGITDKWSETGWIVTDGTQLDFSGRHWEKYDDEIDLGESYYSNKRNAEHYEILDAFTDTASSTMADRGRALDLFLSRGNIRVDAKYGIAELGDIEPTEQQYEKLYKFFVSCSKNGVVVVGYDRLGKHYGETFREGTSPASIVDSIRKFFRTNASAQSDLMRFHTASDDMYFSDRDDIGYHAGDLGKAEYLKQQSSDRDTGHFGTGTYFVGEAEKVTKDDYYGKRPQHAVDFSNYNLFKVRNDRQGYRLHDALRAIDGGVNADWIMPASDMQFDVINPTEHYDIAKEISPDKFWEDSVVLQSYERIADKYGLHMPTREEFVTENNGYDFGEDFDAYYVDYVKESIGEQTDNINEEYRKFLRAYDDLELLFNMRKGDINKALRKVAHYQNETSRDSRSDSYATVFMKAMGYEGVDVRGTGLDNTGFGSVIYDVRDNTVLYSDRDSSSLDNRTILANAMETAAQNDVEKKYVDDYRKNIDKLNAEEQKLGELRAEIKKLSFSKGPRDTVKLKSLQDEATKTANRINVYDKKLLKLEAAKPLKDVIERERNKARKAQIEKGKESLQRSRERSSRTVMRNKIKKVVRELDNYLRKGTKDKHVMEGLKNAVASALEAVNMDTVSADNRLDKIRAEIAKENDPIKVNELMSRYRRVMEQGDKMADRLSSLKSAYEEIKNSSDPTLANAYDEVISNSIEAVKNEVGNTPLRDMSMSQLEAVYKLYKMVLTTVRDSNKAFKAAKAASIDSIASRVMAELDSLAKKSKLIGKFRDLVEKFGWNNLKPVYAFKAMGSGTLSELFNNIRSGEDVWARDIAEAKEFFGKAAKDYGIDQWDMTETFEFTASSGKTFNLNLQQIMSLYAFSKREQARDHIRRGGIVIDERTELKKGLRTFTIEDATAYNISDETLNEIIGKLTEKQRNYVDLMQGYLSSAMGNKGNEVSLELYGVKLFNEKNYFPLKSAAQYMPKAKEQQQGEVKIKNAGFTKETTQHANNPIVLSEFNDVWAGHVDEMSRYHAFTLPLEDFYRVYNYRTSTDETRATESITAAIEDVSGKGATQYIDQLLRDLNGGTRVDSTTGVVNKGLSLFKKGAVMGSLSVVIQQPSAIARALAYIDLKYFIGPKVKFSEKAWDEVKKYAPVAIIKEMGGYDTHVGQSTKDYITGEKGNILNKFDDLLGKAPELADQVTWCAIWQAAKRKAKTEGNLAGEALLKRAGEIFTEAIVNTQVYDSVIARSAMMRSKDGLMKMATAFMAEPTTSINMIADARLDWQNGNKKSSMRKVSSVVASVVLNSALVSIIYAMRDDDDDETFWEKYISSVISKTMDGINPVTYIPFVKDIYSEIQGYTTKRTDISVFSDLIKAVQNFEKSVQKDEDILNASIDLANQCLMIFGIPTKNITRDVRAFINTYGVAVNGEKGSAAGTWYAVWEGITEGSVIANKIMGGKPSNKEQLYNAVSEGDAEHEQRVRNRYDDEKKANSAFAQAVVESYSNGNITKQQAIDLLVRKGGMEKDTAEKKMFNAEFKTEHGFSFNEKAEAYADGRITRNELITILMNSGKTREEAESQVTVYEWQNEGYDIESNQSYIIEKFNEFCVPAGIDRQTYMNYRSATVSIKGDRKEKVMDIIDSMSLTAAQKDALYYLEGWAASKIYEAPWH